MTKTSKIEWVDFYLGLAKVISKKSPDTQTQHGCVITCKDNRPLGFGFNGFPRGVNDSDLPTTRPDKYPWMYHSEKNALANCILRPEGGIAYVTGQCCNDCIYAMWQHGVKTVHMLDAHGTHLQSVTDKEWWDTFIKKTAFNVQYHEPNFSWLSEVLTELTT